jgi:hypothetical protein
VFGALTWVRPINQTDSILAIETFIPGQLRGINASSVVIPPATVPDRLDQIQLWAGDKSVDLSKLRYAVCQLVVALEQAMTPPSNTTAPCDGMAQVVIQI